MILEITKQSVIMITMRIMWVFDVNKVAYELFGDFAKVGAPQPDSDSKNPQEIFHENVSLAENFDRNILYSYSK